MAGNDDVFSQLVLSETSPCKRFEFVSSRFRPTVCASCAEPFTSHERSALTQDDAIRYLSILQEKDVAHRVWTDPLTGGILYVGGYAASGLSYVAKERITHIVNAAGGLEGFFVAWAKQLPDVEKLGVQFLRLGWTDCDTQRLFETAKWDTLRRAVLFIEEGIRGGGRVVVHCAQGKSRSATAAVAYVMAKERLSRDAALAHVRSGRRVAEPNNGFMRQLAEFELSDDLAQLREELRHVSATS